MTSSEYYIADEIDYLRWPNEWGLMYSREIPQWMISLRFIRIIQLGHLNK
jgi:hypothetical protein